MNVKVENIVLVSGIVAVYAFLLAVATVVGFLVSTVFGNVVGGVGLLVVGVGTVVPFSMWLANRLDS